ncbi:hypothetical protein GCM10007159_41130 [Modicisalibacter luteus]|nr:hypothetical protein GCM10007159_41130 [Halomonas lutea]
MRLRPVEVECKADFPELFGRPRTAAPQPITGLKIDRAVVSNQKQDERARKLMFCMIDMGTFFTW